MTFHKAGKVFAAALIAVATTSPAYAKSYDISVNNESVAAAAVEQPKPLMPEDGIRRGQEAWVRVNFIITAEGDAIEPIIVDSSGGSLFEDSVREAVSRWRFEASGEQLANNTAEVRFELQRGLDRATKDFLRRYRNIANYLRVGAIGRARETVDVALEYGGWNLYESTMLWLLAGRVDGAEGNIAGQLESYRRALGLSDRASLDGVGRRDLLLRIFELEFEHTQYAAAQSTLQLLRGEPGGEQDAATLEDKILAMERALDDPQPIAARATVFSPCNSGAGQPLWSYTPVRRTFSFAALSGNVERFEVRCEGDRLQGLVATDKTWSLPADGGNCRVFVFGDDGASFEFVEHTEANADDATEQAAVAGSNVLD